MGGFFKVEQLKIDIDLLEQKTLETGFWGSTNSSKSISVCLSRKKSLLKQWNLLSNTLEDASAMLSLVKGTEVEEREPEIKELESMVDSAAILYYTLNLESKLNQPHDRLNAVVSLHAGAGGTEACDWVDMLYRMYERWAFSKNFSIEVINFLSGEEAGIKSITFFVKGVNVYGYLQSEVGIHRLVRVSPFDSNKRRHTSFASCDVLPEIEDDIEIEINEDDLRVDTYRSSGAGGQHVNKTDSAVRITHIPSGVIVACQNERSQIKNRSTCMKLLKAKLYDLEQEKFREEKEKRYNAQGQIAWGHQIRSYVFMPYQMVKDARTNCLSRNVQSVMDGNLDPFINAYLDMYRISTGDENMGSKLVQ